MNMHIYPTTNLLHWTLSINQDQDVMCQQAKISQTRRHLHLPFVIGLTAHYFFSLLKWKQSSTFYLFLFCIVYAHILAASPTHIDRFPLFRGRWTKNILFTFAKTKIANNVPIVACYIQAIVISSIIILIVK